MVPPQRPINNLPIFNYLEGFSLLTHEKIPLELPICKVIRFNIEYTIEYIEEDLPENFTIRELDLFCEYYIYSDCPKQF